MGYACPVCETPHADGVHLANHLAFTALLRGGDHEEWLDERVPEWENHGESWLGERVVEYAESAELPYDPEEGESHEHDHPAPIHEADREITGSGESSEAVTEALREARELTRERRENSETE